MSASDRLRRVASHLLTATGCADGEPVDLVIRQANVVDGTGKPGFQGDVAVKGGQICFVGPQFLGQAKKEVNGAGQVLAPGFIDFHTHFDPYLSWDGRCDPTAKHGVTTVVVGNCSISVAPCKDADMAGRIVRMFGCIEDIRPESFYAGVPFEKWKTFPEWLDHIRPNLTVNVGALVGHSLVRMVVMGEESQKRTATPEEIQAQCEIIEEAMMAGALGFSGSMVDVDETNTPVPARYADWDEKIALCQAATRAGKKSKWSAGGKKRGVLSIVPKVFTVPNQMKPPIELEPRRPELGPKTDDPEQDMIDSVRELGHLSRAADITTTFQPLDPDADGVRRRVIAVMEEEAKTGARIYGQTTPRDMDQFCRLGETSVPLTFIGPWERIMREMDIVERQRKFADPANRKALVESMKKREKQTSVVRMKVTSVVHPDNQKYLGKTVREIADAEGKECGDVVLDLSLKDNLQTEFSRVGAVNTDKKALAEHLLHPQLQLGASDAGAHITQQAGHGDSTFMLETMVKKEKLLTLEFAIKKQTKDLAEQFHMHDRGTLEVGKAADLVLFDLNKLERGMDTFDALGMPGGQNRYTRYAKGYSGVWVNGAQVLENDEYTNVTGCGQVV